MINTLQTSLESALSKLYNHFPNDSETLHEAVALVFSSIFRKFGIQCIIVGGQSAAYWMRIPSSTDVDFVTKNGNQISEALENCGFIKIDNFQFRFKHPSTNILIELVDDQITIKGVRKIDTVEVQQEEIEDPIVKALMPGPAEILDPVRVFLNYVEASSNDSIWFDYEDHGSLAIERAHALFDLYKNVILPQLNTLIKNGDIDNNLVRILINKFHIVFGS